jgi:AraC family transcriptional regulator
VKNNELTNPIRREDAFLVALQVRDCPRHELWIDNRPAPTAALPAGVTCLYYLRTNPIAYSVSAFHSFHFYLPRRALDAIADLDDVVRIDDLDRGGQSSRIRG